MWQLMSSALDKARFRTAEIHKRSFFASESATESDYTKQCREQNGSFFFLLTFRHMPS
jgi:hypothetical protein